jgi:hypothetical protein
MSAQSGSSSGGSKTNGSTPIEAKSNGFTSNGSTASPPELLESPVLQEFTELTYKLAEAIESSKRMLHLSNNEIGALRESVRTLDLRLSTVADGFDASSKQNHEATSVEIGVLRESLSGLDFRLSSIAQQFDGASKKPQQATSEEVAGLRESVASLNDRLSALAEQSLEERQARIDAEARIACLEEEIASGSQLAELDLAGLQQTLAATRSQCLMLETQQQAMAIKVEGLIKRADKTSLPIKPALPTKTALPTPSPNVPGVAIATPHEGAAAPRGNSASSELLSRVNKPQDQNNEGVNPPPSPSARPAPPPQVAATKQRSRSVKILPLLVGGVAASTLLGSSLIYVIPSLFSQPEPGTPAKTVSLPQKPLPASSEASPAPAVAASKPAPAAQDKLKIYCPADCWVEVRSVVDGKTLYDGLLKGSVQFPIGKGLNVSSGRSDILKLKINDGAPFVLNTRQMLSSRLVNPPS